MIKYILFSLVLIFTSCSFLKTDIWQKSSLKQASSRPIGVAVDYPQLAENNSYRDLLLREFDSITTENALKMNVVQAKQGVYDFTQADYIVDFAVKHKLKLRAHPLIWHRQLPSWLAEVKPERFEKVFEEYIRTLVKRYKGKVDSWDVVNEAFLRNGDYRPNIWFVAIGPSYVEKAFQIARSEDPNAKLFYNDYQIEKDSPKFKAVYQMLKTLKAKGVPISGVGLQGHFSNRYNVKENELALAIKEFSSLGLEVQITELDVAVRNNVAPDSKMQKETYKLVAKTCHKNKSCRSITLWGISDANSWIENELPGYGKATLFDSNFMPKSVYDVFRSSLD